MWHNDKFVIFLNSVIKRFEITKFGITKFVIEKFIFIKREIKKFEITKFMKKKFVCIKVVITKFVIAKLKDQDLQELFRMCPKLHNCKHFINEVLYNKECINEVCNCKLHISSCAIP